MNIPVRALGNRRPRLLASFFSCIVSAQLGACQLQVDEKDIEDLADIEVCDGMTLAELVDATTISASCKASLEAYLPQPASNFSSTVVILGSQEEADGSLTVYAHGADANGQAIDSAAWADVQVSVEVDGFAQVLAAGDFSMHLVADATGDLLSIGIVNDYSGSMVQGDLQTVASIETDLFSYVPPVYEAEVTQFSSDVVVKQPFTTDQDALLGAVAYDESFDQQLTALYDGMGTGLDSLLTRNRPLRLLIVATDGQENDSQQYTRDEIIALVAAENVPVLMLGALFAEPAELRSLAGSRGVYFYTPYYDDARAQVEQYLTSLSNLVAINIPPDARGDGPVVVEADGAQGEL